MGKQKGSQSSGVLENQGGEGLFSERSMELNSFREDMDCEKSVEHCREDFIGWQIDWNFLKPQDFLKGFSSFLV